MINPKETISVAITNGGSEEEPHGVVIVWVFLLVRSSESLSDSWVPDPVVLVVATYAVLTQGMCKLTTISDSETLMHKLPHSAYDA